MKTVLIYILLAVNVVGWSVILVAAWSSEDNVAKAPSADVRNGFFGSDQAGGGS